MAISTTVKIGLIALLGGGSVVGIGYIFSGKLFLYEVERKVLEDDVYLSIGEKTKKQEVAPTQASQLASTEDKSTWTIQITAKSDSQDWKDKNYSWECTIELDSEAQDKVDKTKLEARLPTSASHKDVRWRQDNKTILLYICSFFKDRSKTNDTQLVSTLPWPSNKTVEDTFSSEE